MKLNVRGFSFIPIMVVIAILGILISIGAALYKQRQVKMRIKNSLPTIIALAQNASLTYERTKKWPDPYIFSGLSFTTAGDWQPFMQNDIFAMKYAVGSKGIFIGATLSGLEAIGGYVEPGEDVIAHPSHLQAIFYATRVTDRGTLDSRCGIWPVDNQSIPLRYLPSNCQCTDVHDWWENGTGC